MRQPRGFRALSAATLAFAVLVPNCGQNVVADQREPITPAVPMSPTEPPLAPSATGVTPWPAIARSTLIEERQGQPVNMKEGVRCQVYRELPSLRYSENTLVQDACLAIPGGALVEVAGGVTLVIVATNGLRLGKDVTFDAKGASGRRGARAPFASIRRQIGTEAEINALCVDRGNQCECPTPAMASLDAIRGRAGEQGSPGGSIHIVVGALVTLTGFASDVSGGVGGPPGDSGTQECARGDVRCTSPACSAGAGFGPAGPPGKVVLSIGGVASAAATAWTIAHTTPSGALSVVEPGPSLLERAAELDNEAVQRGFQRRSGRTP